MIPLLIGLAVVFGLVLLVLLYWSMLDSLFPEKLSTNEVVLVTTQDLWKIRMCRYRKGRTGGQPVLLVHGANTNQHNFTSPEGVSLVDALVERGYDCWTVDLRGCRSSVPPFERTRSQIRTDDFLNDDIPTAIRYIQQETGYARIHYVGHSLGGMLLYAYALKYGTDNLASGTTLGSPLGFEDKPGRRSPFMFKLAGLFPALSGSFVRGVVPVVSCFRLSPAVFPTNMRNVARTMHAGHFYRMIEDPLPGVLDDLCRWVNRPGWRMDGGNLNVLDGLAELDLPLFVLYAPQDPFVSLSNAKAFFDALPASDKRMLVCAKEHGFKHDYNHCDLAFSHEGAREIFGPIARWIETHPSRERMPIETPEIATGYQSPLKVSQRAEILSGDSYARVAEAPTVAPEADTPETDEDASTPTLKAPKRPAKKKTAPRKKPVARKKAPAKKTTARKKPATKAVTPPAPTEEAAVEAPKTTSGTAKKAPARSGEGGPDLAAASAALSALGRAPRRPAEASDSPKINVKSRPTAKASKKADSPVETPQSVLKALSSASDVLGSMKAKKEEDPE